jgi:FixJ family two-component response regulator
VPGHLVIAVVDDDDSFRVALVESLSSLGFRVFEYASAADFIAASGCERFDVVVSDVHMPGVSGLELMRLLVASGSVLPVILITARAEAGLETRAAAAGATGFLWKPFAIFELVKCIEESLEERL